jgi:hypothetical protein
LAKGDIIIVNGGSAKYGPAIMMSSEKQTCRYEPGRDYAGCIAGLVGEQKPKPVMGALLLTMAFASGSFSASATLPIDILGGQFTTLVSLASYYPNFLPGGVLSNDVREVVSSAPVASTIYNYRSGGGVVAEADASLLEISAYTSITYDGYVDSSVATVRSEIWFSPLSSQTASLNLEFLGEHMWFYSQGSVSLTDITSGQEIWNYGWAGPSSGTVPWEVSAGLATASLTLNTDFSATDTYYLNMYTETAARGDAEFIQIQMVGLEPIPEPASAAVAALGTVLALVFRHVKRRTGAVQNRHRCP